MAALHGRVTAHHRFMLKLHLTQIEALEAAVRDVEARLGEALAPFWAAVERLITMPDVSQTVARVIVAEIGFEYDPLPHRGASRLLGRSLPPAPRKRGQAPLESDAVEQIPG